MFQFGDQPDYCAARFLNPDFSRISKHKTILKSRASSVTLADLEKLDRCSRTILAGESQCFWLLSSLLAQLCDEGYKAVDPALFDKNISTLSASLASQTTMTAGISDFITLKRRESYLAHASCPIAESVKRDLLVAPGSDNFLFNQPLLEKVVTTVKEDSIISSTASLASLSRAASRDVLELRAPTATCLRLIIHAQALQAIVSDQLLLAELLTSVVVRVGA